MCGYSQLPKYIYVDDVEQSGAKISESFRAAAVDLEHSIGVLLDSTHLIRRYMRTCKNSHPLYGELLVSDT